MIDSLVQWLLQLIHTMWYFGIAVAMFMESFFAPIPSEAIVPLWWFLAFEGKLELWKVIVVGWVASYLGSLPFYFLGYRWHRAKINTFVKKYWWYLWIQEQDVESSFDLFKKYGYAFVFFWRCIPIVRTFVSFPAGSVRMNFALFSLLSILWATLWSAILAWAWYALGTQRESVANMIKDYEHIVLILLAICVVWFVRYILRQRRSN